MIEHDGTWLAAVAPVNGGFLPLESSDKSQKRPTDSSCYWLLMAKLQQRQRSGSQWLEKYRVAADSRLIIAWLGHMLESHTELLKRSVQDQTRGNRDE
ncbi:hypothetical protein CF108_19915 [Aeromonas veronii]|nr:hypothetical protein CF108_19915 [Aeromonas veronii]